MDSQVSGNTIDAIGVFAVYMPLLYGEGERAFHHLQVETTKPDQDLSILAWRHTSKYRLDRTEVIAASPDP